MHSSLTLEALDERLRQLEVTHVRKLAEAEKRDRDSLAPTPDYAIERPASGEPRPCGCEEAVALRAELAKARADYRRLEEVAEEACDETVRDIKRLAAVRAEAQRLVFGDAHWHVPIGRHLLTLIDGEGA